MASSRSRRVVRFAVPVAAVPLAAAAILATLAGRGEAQPAGGRTPAAGATAAARPVTFNDATAAAGFGGIIHAHGGTGRKFYIETVPPGVCWLDYDKDGWQDVYFVQSGLLPGTLRPSGTPHSRLFRNRGDGTFIDVTEKAGAANASGYGNGCTAGDYDNDGDLDLYVTNFGPSVLYRNNGDGTFTDVAGPAGGKNSL